MPKKATRNQIDPLQFCPVCESSMRPVKLLDGTRGWECSCGWQDDKVALIGKVPRPTTHNRSSEELVYMVPLSIPNFSTPRALEDFFNGDLFHRWKGVFLYGQAMTIPCVVVFRLDTYLIGEAKFVDKVDANDPLITDEHRRLYEQENHAVFFGYIAQEHSYEEYPNPVPESAIRDKTSGTYRTSIAGQYLRVRELAGLRKG